MFSGGCATLRRRASLETCRLFHHHASPSPHSLCTKAAAPSFSTSSTVAETSRSGVVPPVNVSVTDSTGRGVFATRRIISGDLIHTAKPLVTHPSLGVAGRICYYCLRRLRKDTSSGIISSSCFCSEQCREESEGFYQVENIADWSLYHDHCRDKSLKYPLMVKRFASMVISGAASSEALDILQPANLLPEAISEMEEEFELLKCTFKKAQIDEKLTAFLTKNWYMGVIARIRINAFRVELVATSHEDLFASAAASVTAEASVGNAVYMLPSMYNHDCDPNTHILWIDNTMARIKALRDIEKGEELRICYIDASMEREARQAILAHGFGFHCRCFKCLSEQSSSNTLAT